MCVITFITHRHGFLVAILIVFLFLLDYRFVIQIQITVDVGF